MKKTRLLSWLEQLFGSNSSKREEYYESIRNQLVELENEYGIVCYEPLSWDGEIDLYDKYFKDSADFTTF